MKSWFSISNKAEDPHADIYLFDEIGGFGITSQMFTSAFASIPMDRKIVMHIDSRGGDVDAGLAIYDVISQRRDQVTARVSGIAASIASVIICGAGKVVMPKHALMLIHNPWTQSAGDAEEHRKRAEWLDKIAGQIIGIYAAKTGKSKEEIKAIMDEETLLTAKEAKAFGFCDELLKDASAKAFFETFCRIDEPGTKPAASDKPEETPPPKPQTSMNKLLNALVEAKLISSATLAEDAATAEFQNAWKTASEELTKARNAADKAKDDAADAAVKAAIEAKKIKDEEGAKAFWKNSFKADPKAAQAAIDAIEVAPAKNQRGTAPVPPQKGEKTDEPELTGRARVAAAFKAKLPQPAS